MKTESTNMKMQTIAHVSAAEFRRTLAAFIADCGSQQNAAAKIGVSQTKLHQAVSRSDFGRRVPAYFGLRVERLLVPKKTQGK